MVLPRNHNQNLEVCCVYCLNKFKTGKNTKSPLQLEKITDTIKNKIAQNFYHDYYENESVLPQKVCKGCAIKLRMLGTKNERKMDDPPDYPSLVASAISVPEEKRSEIGYKCGCNICEFASYSSAVHGNAPMPNPMPPSTAGPSRPPPPRPPPPARPPPPRPATSPSQQVVVDLPQPNSPPSSPPPEVGFISPPRPKRKSIFDGLTNTQTWDELMKLPISMREMVATDVLDENIKKVKALGLSSFKMSRRNGPKFEYHIIEKAQGAFEINVDVLNSLSTQLGLSQRQTLKAKNILQDHGATSKTYVKEDFYAFHQKAKSFFDAREMIFECSPIYDDDEERSEDMLPGNNLRYAIVCNDVPGYIAFMQEQRQLDENITLQVGLDGGKARFTYKLFTMIQKSELR